MYREGERAFSEGDRVQFTAPDKTLKIANRELGTIESIDGGGTSKSNWTPAARCVSISKKIGMSIMVMR